MCRLCKDQAEHDGKVASAKAIADHCRHYALLHHRMRIAELEKVSAPDWLTRELLKQSRRHVANPAEHGSSYAGHFDAEYIAKLDAFANMQQA